MAAAPEILRQAVAHHQAGRLVEAEAGYRAALALAPRNAEILLALAGVCFQLGRAAEAAQRAGEAAAANPRFAEAHHLHGVALGALGREEEAVIALRRAVALQPGFADALSNLGLMLKTLGRNEEAVTALQAAIARDPRLPQAHKHLGDALAGLGRNDEALAVLDRALALAPRFAEAVNSRGVVLLALGRPAEAAEAFARFAELSPNAPLALLNMGLALTQAGRFPEAVAAFDRALAARPDYAQAHYSKGVALAELADPHAAIAAFTAAIALRPDFAEAHFARSLSRLLLGDYEAGFAEYEWRKRLPAPLGVRDVAAPLLAPGEDVAGRRIFLHCEQGLGDAIQFARYAPLLEARGAQVTLAAPALLVRLLKTLSPTIEVIDQAETPLIFDAHAPLMSLPLIFGTRLDSVPASVPYLAADPALAGRWRERLGPGDSRLKVGLAWKANARAETGPKRSMPLAEALDALARPAVRLVSLVKEYAEDELALIAAAPERLTAEPLDDFADTAGLVAGLDLVITVDTAVAHLAGALGKPVWLVLPHAGEWRWLQGAQSPWYPTARVFRQPALGDWHGALSAVRDALAAFPA